MTKHDDPSEHIHEPTDADFGLSIEEALAALCADDASQLPPPPEGMRWTHPNHVTGSGIIRALLARTPVDEEHRYQRSTPEQNMRDMQEQIAELRRHWVLEYDDTAAGIAAWEQQGQRALEYQRELEAERLAREPVVVEQPDEPVDRGRGAGTHLRTMFIGDEGVASSDGEPEKLGPNEISPRVLHARKMRQLRGSTAPIVGEIKRGE